MLHATRWQRVWRVLFAVLVVAIAVLALSPRAERLPTLGWDKLNHLAAFAALAAVGLLCRAPPAPAAHVVRLAAGGLLYGALIELAQTQVPGRSAELADLLADALGIALGLAAATGLRRAVPPERPRV